MIRKEIIQNFSLNFVKMLKQFNYIIIFALLIISCNKNNVIEINTPQLLKRLVQHKVKKLYLILDSDAQKDSMKIVDKLKSYQIKVNLITLKDKDPSELGFEKTINLIKQTKDSLSFSDIMKMKLGA